MSTKIDAYIRELVLAFSSLQPKIDLAVSFREGVYIVKVDHKFTLLSAEEQHGGRRDINTLMLAINHLGVVTWLELGEV